MNKIKGTFRINKNMNLNSTQNNKRKYGKSFRYEENFHFIIVLFQTSLRIFFWKYMYCTFKGRLEVVFLLSLKSRNL